MDDPRVRALQAMPIFGGLQAGSLAILLERARRIEVPRDEFFFHEGDPGTSTFVLQQGSVMVLKRWEGQEHVLRNLAEGDCFGEVALLDFGPRSASVLAEADCTALELDAKDLLAIAKASPSEYALIYMNIGRELSRRLRSADEILFQLRLEGGTRSEEYRFGTS
jgi:CRP-like cAMP-binding protein